MGPVEFDNRRGRSSRRLAVGGLGAGTAATAAGEVLLPQHAGSWLLDTAFAVQLVLLVVVTLTMNRSAFRDDETRRQSESRRTRLYEELAENMRLLRETMRDALGDDAMLRRWLSIQEKVWRVAEQQLQPPGASGVDAVEQEVREGNEEVRQRERIQR